MIMNVGTVGGDGAPLVTPIWFIFEDGRIWFTPRQHSEWLRHIRADNRVAMSIDESAVPYRKVVVRGSASIDFEVGNDDAWRDRYRRIAQRYISIDDANSYVDGTDDQPRALCSLVLADAEVRSWRMPIDDESIKGFGLSVIGPKTPKSRLRRRSYFLKTPNSTHSSARATLRPS